MVFRRRHWCSRHALTCFSRSFLGAGQMLADQMFHDMLTALALPRRTDLVPIVGHWLLTEWPDWYGAGGPGDLRADMAAFAASETSLPIGFVALNDGVPMGFCALKAESIESHKHLSPWVGAGFVLPGHRRHGIGAFLLQAITDHARHLGHGHVYCATSTSSSLLRRVGWELIDNIAHAGEPMAIFKGQTASSAEIVAWESSAL
nr:Csw005 [uncultured bacterium]